MANLEGMKQKFIVIKNEDIEKYLTTLAKEDLDDILFEIYHGRKRDGKKNNTYLVINTDEPYADEIIEILKRNGHWG